MQQLLLITNTYLFVDPGVSHWGEHGNYGTDEGEPRGKIAEWAQNESIVNTTVQGHLSLAVYIAN